MSGFEADDAVLEFDVATIALVPSRLDAFVKAALRARIWGARRILAHGIDPSQALEELLAEVRTKPADRIAKEAPIRRSEHVATEAVGAWWRALGRVVALQGFDAADRKDGLLLHEIARLLAPVSTWSAEEALTYAQLLWVNGQYDRLRRDEDLLNRLDGADRLSLAVDLAASSHGIGSTAWNGALASMLGEVPPVTVRPGATTPFDGLCAVDSPRAVDGPLVSVIMSAFRPGPEILTSVRSILDQSWTNLELLVVDDASGAEYAPIFERIAGMDSRIRVMIQPANRGTYGARNRALPETRGDFVTFQDSDDWSHPERIERQVLRLLDDPALPAVMSRSIRCTPELDLQLLGYHTTRPNVSSLMLRRSTIETLGYFDHVRKSADSEYELRIAAHYGRRVPVMSELLAFVRLDPDSLSRSDFKPGWWHPARYAYRDAYRRWHESITAGADPWLPPSAEGRKFPAPQVFLRATDHQPDERPFDDVFVDDWREAGGRQSALLQQVYASASSGRRVGIMHLESLRSLDCRTDALCREISDLQCEGVITRVLPDDPVIVKRLVLGDPELLIHAPWPTSALHVDQIVVLAPNSPEDASSRRRRYSPSMVAELARTIWGKDPVWLPGGQHARAALSTARSVHLGPVEISGFYVSRPRLHRETRGRRPIIGAVVGMGGDEVPGAEDFARLFPIDDRFDVRLIASRQRLSQIVGSVPPHWLIYRPGEISQYDLYHQIDFYVSPSGVDEVRVIPRVVDAVSAGAVAVAPPQLAAALGEAAVYAAPDEVSDTVKQLFVNRRQYVATITRSQEWARAHFSTAIPNLDLPSPRRATGINHD